jgi:Scramblase
MHRGLYERIQIASLNGVYAYTNIPSDDVVWSWKPHSTIPGQLKMSARAGSDMLSEHADLYVKHTRRNWFQELLGYEAKSEFHIATLQNRGANIMYAREDSSFWARLFYLNLHPWDMSVWHGDSPGGVKLADYHRPVRCAPCPMKCCCHQQIHHKDTNGESIGVTVEDFYYCVPKFNVQDSLGNVEFVISNPTCLNGRFVDCFEEGVFTCRVPFYIYPAGSTKHVAGVHVGKIVKTWNGFQKLYTDADTFELSFPSHSNSDSKARLLGSLFIVNQLYL